MARASQTFFVPESIREQRLSKLPLSRALACVLLRLDCRTFSDLAGVTLRDFERVSGRGRALFQELSELIQRARRGEFGPRPPHSTAPGQGANCPVSGAASAHGASAGGEAQKPPAGDAGPRDSQDAETVFIPPEAQETPLTAFAVPPRLWHVLECRKLKRAGDLQGLVLSEVLRKWSKCGKKTLDELRRLVHAIQQGPHAALAPSPAGGGLQEVNPSIVNGMFFIEDSIRSVNVSELPLSPKLEGVLRAQGVLSLGDLHDLPVARLMKIPGCGRKAISELIRQIARAAGGDFDPQAVFDWSPAALVRTLDALVAELPARNAGTLLMRLGAKGDEASTSEEVAAKIGVSRERVRQIVAQSVQRIRKCGGRRLGSYLDHVEGLCREAAHPLTPALFNDWLEGTAAGASFGAGFYVRLLAMLQPAIPTCRGMSVFDLF